MQGFIRCQEKLLQRNIGVTRTWFLEMSGK